MKKLKLAELTVHQSLEETVAMWNWVAESPGMRRKKDWPGLAAWDSMPRNDCFLCEVITLGDCSDCPLFNRWGVRRNARTVDTCMRVGKGLYALWLDSLRLDSPDKEKARCARLIAERAAEVLAELVE